MMKSCKIWKWKVADSARASQCMMLICWLLASCTHAQQADERWPAAGELRTLTANEISASRWSIGGETLDRDYANYDAYKEYLGPLGAKRIRLQGGWAKCEKVKGQYDFAWLDAIVDDALQQGVKPWLQTSYGNPIYDGGGDAALGGGIPTSEEALAAWDKWVAAMVAHFKDRVVEWEIWNEPDLSKKFTAEETARFHERTADVIKREQPEARLIMLALAGPNRIGYVEALLEHFKRVNKLDYLYAISFHGYRPRPEDTYEHVTTIREKLSAYGVNALLWQGENGAPSTPKGEAVGALTNLDWSETTQAKWNLRRMMGDLCQGVDVTNVFQIADMYYAASDHMKGLNSKGLLKMRPDRSLERPKLAYGAVQNAMTLFSGEVTPATSASPGCPDDKVWVYAFNRNTAKGEAILFWSAEAVPVDNYTERTVEVTVNNVTMKQPVLIDLLTGEVYEVPEKNRIKKGKTTTFTSVPVSDAPRVIADRSWVKLK